MTIRVSIEADGSICNDDESRKALKAYAGQQVALVLKSVSDDPGYDVEQIAALQQREPALVREALQQFGAWKGEGA